MNHYCSRFLREGETIMIRFTVLLAVLLMSAAGFVSPTAAQDDTGEQEVTCASVPAEEAQALLDADPTYANRERLDADDDGIACNEEDEVDCTSLTAEEVQALLDAEPTYANRERLDPDDDGIACEEPGSTTMTPPVVGTGTAVAAATNGIVFALMGLALLFGVAAVYSYRRI